MANSIVNSPGIAVPAQTREIALQIPLVHACYADHFPGNPIVPGALLLKWIAALLKRDFKRELLRIKQVKFLAPVKPGDQLQLQVDGDIAAGNLRVTLSLGDMPVLKGVMELASSEGAPAA